MAAFFDTLKCVPQVFVYKDGVMGFKMEFFIY